MADMRETKALARKRLAAAEMAAMVHEGAEAAKLAVEQEKIAFMQFLELDSALKSEKKRFLVELMTTGLNTRACLASGTPLRTFYQWQADDPDFRDMVAEVKKISADRLEQVAIDLATGAYMRPLVSQGRIAAYERIYDTKMALALLRARKPQEFAQKIDVTSNGHSLVKLIDKDAWDSV